MSSSADYQSQHEGQMVRALIKYLSAVLIFGSLTGWSNSLNSEFSPNYHFITAYVVMAFLWGSIFFTSLIDKINASNRTKSLIIVVVALSAGAITTFYLSYFGQGEVIQNVTAGWGEDRSAYKEYPLKGYALVGSTICFMYIVLGFLRLIKW